MLLEKLVTLVFSTTLLSALVVSVSTVVQECFLLAVRLLSAFPEAGMIGLY